MDVSPLYARIAQRLEETGLSEREASLRAFGNSGTLRNIRTGTSKSPGIDTFQKLAPVLGVSAVWLAFGVEAGEGHEAGGDLFADNVVPFRRQGAEVPTIRLVGEVAAGRWLDVDTAVDEPAYEAGPIPADPLFDPAMQFAVQVRGTSINRVARDGAILGCVDVQRARLTPRDGDLVVVERRRYGGSEIERTAKRLHLEGGVQSLWPDSTDPKWQSAIEIAPEDGDETATVQIIGLVSMVHERVGRDISATKR